MEGRFWVYTNDLEGDMVRDYGNFDDRQMADLTATTILDTAGFDPDTMVVRIVDMQHNDGQTTIWIAAPINYIMHTYGGSDDSRR